MPYKNKEEQKAYQKAHYQANKEEMIERGKAHYQANKEKILKQRKVYREANKEKIAKQNNAHYQANKEKMIERVKAHYQANKEKIAEQKKAHYQAYKEKILERGKAYASQRKKSDPLFKLTCSYRNSCYRAFKSIGQKKNNSSLKLLGLKTWQELTKHFESKFYDHPKTGEKMTFDNHGVHGWHVDHIIPLFTAKTEEDVIKLCHYTNLQPLWAEENLSKRNKILDTE